MLTCIYCGATDKQYKKGLSRKGIQRYKCMVCGRHYTPESHQRPKLGTLYRDVIECLTCGKETTNPKFCSQSCAAIYTNKAVPKRKRAERYCKHCNIPLTGYYRTVCDACNPSRVDWSTRTVKNVRDQQSYQASSEIRRLGRSVYRASDRPKHCERCGYNKYYEVCHIRAIYDFPDDTLVTEINVLENLLALCPNCHWELDHGRLRYEDGVFMDISPEVVS
jgi:hypothetical protein